MYESKLLFEVIKALLILIWNLIISFGFLSFLDPSWYVAVLGQIFFLDFIGNTEIYSALIISGVVYGFSAFLFLFYPLAGCLADIRWGRYKTVVNSLCVNLWSTMSIAVLSIVAFISFIPLIILEPNMYPLNTIQTVAFAVICVVFGIPVFFAFLAMFCGLISFSANVIQYGMDQLHDAPTDDSVLYIHWYIWTTFAGLLIVRFPIQSGFFSFVPLLVSHSSHPPRNYTMPAKV